MAPRSTAKHALSDTEAYNDFTKWLFFGGEGVIGTNDPEEQEKRVKYTDLVANAVIFQNVVDMTYALRDLRQEGHRVRRETIAALSPYLTRHIRRFGDYVLDLSVKPMPLTASLSSPLAVDDGDAEDDRHVNAEGEKE